MRPLVSVVIANYNYGHFIRECLDSVLAQTYQNWECICVDDGSTDCSVEIIRSYGNTVKLISQENKRLAAARNTGIRAASGDWIAFLDSDDVWHPRKLEIQIEALSLNPQWRFIGSQNTYKKSFEKEDTHPKTQPVTVKDILSSTPISPSNTVVMRSCFEDVGLFDENPITATAADDKDMWLRLAARFPGGRVNAQLCFIRSHPGQLSNRTEAMIKGDESVLKKFFHNNPQYRHYSRMAYAHHNMVAGITMRDGAGRPGKALIYLMKSLALYPLTYNDRLTFSRRVKTLAVAALRALGILKMKNLDASDH